MDNWSMVYETEQQFQAELIEGLLNENGVHAVILNQKDSSYLMFGTIKVMVNKEDKEKAEEIIKSNYSE